LSRCTDGELIGIALTDRVRHPDTGHPLPTVAYCSVFGGKAYAERAELAVDLIVAQAAGMKLEPGADLAVRARARDED